MSLSRFNIRVYGLMINQENEILLVDEEEFNMQFTKFPGGGLELGEGARDCLTREWKEEVNQKIQVSNHFYTTDYFQQSGFHPDQQLISIYYFVTPLEELKIRTGTVPFDFKGKNENGEKLSFRWMPLKDFSPDTVTFPVDKIVAGKIAELFRHSALPEIIRHTQ